MKMKILKTAILVCTLLFAATLWFTGDKPLESQSAFALEPNNHWYWLMHLSIFSTFILDAYTHRRFWSYLVSFMVIWIVAFDMYAYPILHNLVTGAMILMAIANIIYYAKPDDRRYAIVNCATGSALLLLSLCTDINVFLGEVVIEFTMGVAMARRIWTQD